MDSITPEFDISFRDYANLINLVKQVHIGTGRTYRALSDLEDALQFLHENWVLPFEYVVGSASLKSIERMLITIYKEDNPNSSNEDTDKWIERNGKHIAANLFYHSFYLFDHVKETYTKIKKWEAFENETV